MSDANACARRAKEVADDGESLGQSLAQSDRTINRLWSDLRAASAQSMEVHHGGRCERREHCAQAGITQCAQFKEEARDVTEKRLGELGAVHSQCEIVRQEQAELLRGRAGVH
eukprot:7565535-Pyramimonas_sp.AAC.1